LIQDTRIIDQVPDIARSQAVGAVDQAVDLITLFEKELSQIGTVLAGNTGNKSTLRHGFLSSSF